MSGPVVSGPVPRVAVWKFASCDGCQLTLLDCEDELLAIAGAVEFAHFLEASSTSVGGPYDLSIVEGSVTIRDLNRAMGWSLPDEEAATVAGLVIHEARAIPEPRQTFSFHGFRFEVLRKQRNRIAALRITPLAPPEPGAAAVRREGEAATHD